MRERDEKDRRERERERGWTSVEDTDNKFRRDLLSAVTELFLSRRLNLFEAPLKWETGKGNNKILTRVRIRRERSRRKRKREAHKKSSYFKSVWPIFYYHEIEHKQEA